MFRRILNLLWLMAIMVLTPVILMAGEASVTPGDAALTLQAIPSWVVDNQVVIGLMIAAILDFIFAINSKWKSNGILHWIYVMAMKIAGKAV